jgi:phospholipase C
MSAPSHDPIKHIVLLMLENQSFDRMLGCLKAKYSDLEGIDQSRFNLDSAGNVYYQKPTTAKQTDPDPCHEVEHVRTQIENHNGGFVLDYEHEYPDTSAEQRQQIMDYYEVGFLPALHRLADEFTICDRWHSSLPGPTWPNRFFALSGTSSGKVKMPEGAKAPDLAGFFAQTQDTIFDRLNERQRTWHVYYYDIPCSLVMSKLREPHNLAHFRLIDEFFNHDVNDEASFPDFVFIEPKYSGVDQNDDHPPHNVIKGDKLIADVYNAIRSNEELWNSTLLVVAFDEHGGFYDHVEPPPAVPPRPVQQGDEYTFDRYGLRVPALLISPWVGARVTHTLFDHTSVLKYLTEKWGLGPLGARTAAATSVSVELQAVRRDDTVPFIRVPYSKLVPDDAGLEKERVNPHHEALSALSYFLAKEFDVLGTDALGEMVKEADLFERIKSRVGGALISAGSRLTAGRERRVKRQTELIGKVINNVVGRGL